MLFTVVVKVVMVGVIGGNVVGGRGAVVGRGRKLSSGTSWQ